MDVVGVAVAAVGPGSERRPGIRTCTAELLYVITLYRTLEHSFCCTLRMNGPMRIQCKCLVPIYVFPEMKLCSLVILKTEL